MCTENDVCSILTAISVLVSASFCVLRVNFSPVTNLFLEYSHRLCGHLFSGNLEVTICLSCLRFCVDLLLTNKLKQIKNHRNLRRLQKRLPIQLHKCNMGDNNDRSVIYNNAGIRLMDYGNYTAALEMFRGALETKLIHERTLLQNNASAADHDDENMDDDNDEENDQQRCVSPDGSDDSSTSNNTPMRSHQRNDNLDSFLDLLRNMDDQQRQNDLAASSSASIAQGGIITSSNGSLLNPSVSDGISNVIITSFRGYEPYLYRIPFVLPGGGVTSASQEVSQVAQSISCRIVFNLGLIHQTVCRTSCKVASFYEIAATLLSSLPSEFVESSSEMAVITVLLRIAILNNFGVWCYENGEGESMMNSFEQLVDTLDEDQDLIDPSIVRGVRANIQAFLTPNNGVSLAA